ncbi:glycerol-3-phosphate 1-O-acyltransferase [Rubrobacter taiwanensis]|jgi:glycerol-3-phosphate acyltransferase PlsY|uniref:Glycerol-3-phosphate acyltransferase n=1 Tax=Rubrobacter taiwanensis TaxID=185139 RepID=A0A4R1BLW6_9ACTN|nr:glycerol-3-phosphate 1-O-acyltransferase PlsY [Rubrobacter taiwanensis]TCJ18278.1 glycerol-3-phosphate 1-O-acyltransferase [Rubrobacter taiwanensis]
MLEVFLILLGYLMGSVPTGVLAARASGVDVRRVGSGNIGTANVLRAAGKKAAFVTMLGDMAKGFAPVLISVHLTPSTWVHAAVAFAALAGHTWPVFLRFKGGKGVATGAGTVIALAPLVGLFMFAVWWAVVLISRYTSLGAMVTMVLGPVAFILTGQPLPYVAYTVLGAALVIWLHRENIRRLAAGTERKVGQRERLERSGERVR